MLKEKKIKVIKNDFEVKAVEKILPEVYCGTTVRNYYYSLKNNKNQSQVLISLAHFYKIIKDKYKDLNNIRYDRLKNEILKSCNQILHEIFKEADHRDNKAQTWKAFSKIIQSDQEFFRDLLGKYIKTDTDVINLYLTLKANKQIKNILEKNYVFKIRNATMNAPLKITQAPKEVQSIIIQECIRQFLEENPQYAPEQ